MTTKSHKLAICLSLLFVLDCSAQEKLKFNLDFEGYSQPHAFPDDWFKWGNYSMGVDSVNVFSGKYAAMIRSDSTGSSFGSLAFRIPANYEGSNIQLEGYMKLENVENGFAGLLLRIDGDGGPLAFDNMQSQNIHGTHDWKKYSVTTPFPEGAEAIYVAGILVGKGKAWYDQFHLTLDGKDIQFLEDVEKPASKADLDEEFNNGSNIQIESLSEPLIENLDLLGKVWGLLKYHHPEVAAGNYNWDFELFRILPDFLNANDIQTRDEVILKWIDQYGSLETCTECNDTSENAFLKPDHSWMSQIKMDQKLLAKLKEVYENRHQGRHFYIGMVANVGNPNFKNERAYANMAFPDDGFRLLALYKFWNMIHYFFPNRHLIDEDWNLILRKYLPVFLSAKDELEYEIAALRIIGEIKDTHANLWGGGDKIAEVRGNNFAPVHLRFIEDKLVVTDYYNPEMKKDVGLEIGDVINKIDGREVQSIVDSLIEYYPASNQPARLRDIAADMLRSNYDRTKIVYSSKNEIWEKDLKLYPRGMLNIYRWYRRDDEKSYKMLDQNIGYITLKTISGSEIQEIKDSLRNTKGIIIDIRNYPSNFVPFTLGSFFVHDSTPFVKFTNCNLSNPGEFSFTPLLEIQPDSNPYNGKLVVLVNELSQSQAEYTAMAFRAGEKSSIVGSTTAGADGNISSILLPGGLRTMISGIGVYYPDGGETQRIGIVPDIEVKPTIEGVKSGRDELLEKAIEIINLE